jgi:hypothetical protein
VDVPAEGRGQQKQPSIIYFAAVRAPVQLLRAGYLGFLVKKIIERTSG